MAFSTRRSSGPVLRSLSPSGKIIPPSSSSHLSHSSAFASSTYTFSLRSSSDFLRRSSSPTRVSMKSSNTFGSSVRCPFDRSLSPKRSFVLNQNRTVQAQRKNCLCSPTTHPGSFRCSLHKNLGTKNFGDDISASPVNSNRLNTRRSAMTNSLVRIGTVEGELVKRALASLIRPSSHQQRRRGDFKPRPSRLSFMSKSDHLVMSSGVR